MFKLVFSSLIFCFIATPLFAYLGPGVGGGAIAATTISGTTGTFSSTVGFGNLNIGCLLDFISSCNMLRKKNRKAPKDKSSKR